MKGPQTCRSHRLRIRGAIAIGLWSMVIAPAAGQEPDDSLRAELARLAALVDSLSLEVAKLADSAEAEGGGDALARLRAAASSAADSATGPRPQAGATDAGEFVGRQRSLQALNPEISVTGDVLAQPYQKGVDEPHFIPREFELSFVSNLDPFSRARVFASHHSPGAEIKPFGTDEEHEEGGMAVEEGYLEWVGLPGGLALKFGKFYQQLGQLNRWHSHALPFQSRSLPHLAFVGEEALAQTGLSVHWLVPLSGGTGTYEATLEVTSAENEALFADGRNVAVLGHLNGFWNLTGATDLDLGLSWMAGDYDDGDRAGGRNLYAGEVAFTWRPPEKARYRGLTVRGGVMVLSGLLPAAPTPPGPTPLPLIDDRALGYWAMGEARVGVSWLAGVRVDRTENPLDTSETAWLVSPTLTWWQSEFVRVRLEYDLLGRNYLDTDEGRLLVQVTFALGPHKHENY